MPGFAEIMRGIDQRDVGQGLREISGLAPRAGIELFRQQPEIVGDADHTIEQRLRLVEIAKAQALFDRVVGIANDLGLLAEEFDSGEGRQTGNFPQALTHIALINTAHNLGAAKKPLQKPAMQRSK